MTPEEIENQKHIEFYSASLNAWFNTSLEHDKSLLTLSAGGIGLLVTLLTAVGLSSAESLVLYICAIVSFAISIISILAVFKRNNNYIEAVICNKNQGMDPVLGRLDTTALVAFGIGVLFTAIIGISTAINSYSGKDVNMANDKKNQSVYIRESFNGVAKLQSGYEQKSFNGAANLKPSTTTQPTADTGTTPAASSQSSTPQSNDKK
jgi:hypothetical protein